MNHHVLVRLIRRNLLILGVALISCTSFAYEMDTHFYATYSMARYAGIKHEVASVIAASAQWPDETEILGSPLIPEIGIGTKMRRLFHFPCVPIAPDKTAHSLHSTIGSSIDKIIEKVAKIIDDSDEGEEYAKTLNTVCNTEPADESPIAFNMLYEGLQEGNLIKAASAIHTIEDSYAHAGTSSEIGHAVLGHHPDRPFTSPGKYRGMVRSVMGALVAIRMQLPEEVLDKTYFDSYAKKSTLKNYEMGMDELATNYIHNPYVQKDYREDMFKNPEFVTAALAYFFNLGQHISTDGDYIISPNFGVQAWLMQQKDIMAEVNKGAAAKCSLPEFKGARHAPAYIHCLIFKLVQRLIPLRDDQGEWVIDKFRASSILEQDEALKPLVAKYDAKIKALKAQRKDLPMPEKDDSYRKKGKMLEETMRSAIGINEQIAAVRREKRYELTKAYEASRGGPQALDKTDLDNVLLAVVKFMTKGFIPLKLDDEHRMEFEYEGDLRRLEANLRNRNVRQTIFELYGDYVRFVENSKVWSYPAMRPGIQNLPIQQPDVLPLPGEHERDPKSGNFETNIKYITLNYNQIDIWVENMIRYMFPLVTEKLFPSDKCSITSDITRSINGKLVPLKGFEIVNGKADVFAKFFEALVSPYDNGCNPEWTTTNVTHPIDRTEEKVLNFAEDFRTTHMLTSSQLHFFKDDSSLKKLTNQKRKEDGTPLFRPFQAWGQLTSYQKDQLQKAMHRRFEELASNRKDETPYVRAPDNEDINHYELKVKTNQN